MSPTRSGPSRLHAVVLAAGASRRYGAPKQLLRMKGDSLVARSASLTCQAGADSVLVVLGYRSDAIDRALRKSPAFTGKIQPVWNPRWRDGMGRSLACGVRALDRRARAVLVCLADQPMLDKQHLMRLVRVWRENPHNLVAASYEGKLGVPAIFPRSNFGALRSLSGDRGAQGLLASSSDVLSVPMPHAAVDIDYPRDLALLPS